MDKIINQSWRIVKIAKKVPEGFAFQATGFVIPRREIAYIITNSHVIEKAGENSELWGNFVYPINGKPLIVVYKNSIHDLAILKADIMFEGGEEITHFSHSKSVNDVVFTLGYDKESYSHENPRFQSGKIILSLPFVKDKNLFITSGVYHGETTDGLLLKGIESIEGSSGSPIFNIYGDIIGYLIAKHNDGYKEAIGISIGKAIQVIDNL